MAEVKVINLCKSYGKTEALRGVSFDVERGELFGIIGPDGAGKSTLFRILTTLLLADGGTASVAGYDTEREYKAIRECVGYMPGRFSLYQDLTVEENLEFFASVFGTTVEENYGLVADIYRQIEPFRRRRAGKLSGGMKQKLALCCAMIHRPRVLFLDEPTTGVDPVSRKEFWQMLKRLREQGVTILVSTPYMDEAARCDRLALIREGSVIGMGSPEEITAGFPFRLLAVKGSRMYPVLKILRGMEGVISCFSFGDSHHLTYDPEVTGRERILETLSDAGFDDCTAMEISPGVEDCFMWLSHN